MTDWAMETTTQQSNQNLPNPTANPWHMEAKSRKSWRTFLLMSAEVPPLFMRRQVVSNQKK